MFRYTTKNLGKNFRCTDKILGAPIRKENQMLQVKQLVRLRIAASWSLTLITGWLSNLLSYVSDETDAVYVDPDITDSVNYQQPVMPPMPEGLSSDQVYSM